MFFSNNKSSTEILFNDRKNYEVTMPIMLQDPNLYFDLWKENYNLGRIDYKGNAIFLSESFLKPIDDDHSAIFFVTECFNELKTHWEKLIKRGLVTNIDLTPKRSYIDFHANYHDYIEEIHRDSVVYMSQASVLKKVRNINDYIMFFLTFAQKNNIKILNRSTFVTSIKNSVYSSGMAIDIQRTKKDNNQDKFAFFQDSAIGAYLSLLRLYGFRIDINSPWTLIIDLQSPVVKEKIQRKVDNPRKVFDSFFYKAYESDLDVFKVYMTQFYKTFVKTNSENKCFKVSVNQDELLNEILSDAEWFAWYARFKLYEVGESNVIS